MACGNGATPITRARVPAVLLRDRRAVVRFHPGGHLAEVRVRRDRHRSGQLTLDAAPGSAYFTFESRMGGYGVAVSEEYRDGAVHSTLCTPWHDGEEASEPMAWRRWVDGALDSLARLIA
jgi:hypothetical protein